MGKFEFLGFWDQSFRVGCVRVLVVYEFEVIPGLRIQLTCFGRIPTDRG